MRVLFRGLVLAGLLFGCLINSAAGAGYQDLTPLLIDLPGYSAEAGDGMQFDMAGQRLIQAVRMYTADEREVNAMVMIGDQMLTQAPLQEFSFESGQVTGRVEQVDGFTVQSSYDKGERSGAVFVKLQQSGTEGAIFLLAFVGIDEAEGMALAKRFDWAGMKEAVAPFFKVAP